MSEWVSDRSIFMAKPPKSACVELDFIGESMWGGWLNIDN